MKILMIGATGKFAGYVLPELKKRGASVRALVRNQQSARKAQERGANETVIGDLADLRSLISAAEGTDSAFLILPAFVPDESKLGLNFVLTAKTAGVHKIVFSGVVHPTLIELSNHASKIAVEQALYTSGLTYAVLQPAMFMQSIGAAWPHIVQNRKFALPYSKEKKACYVDYRDVAEAAAIALTSPNLDYGTFELCAPGMFSRIEVAQMMSEALGSTVEAADIPFEEFAKRSGIPQGPLRAGLRRMFAEYSEHGLSGGNPLVLRSILGREPRTLRQFFSELASEERKAA